MAKGRGYGFDISIPDLLLYAGLAIGAYYAYKLIIKPTSEITASVADVTKTGASAMEKGENYIGQLITQISDTEKSIFDYFTKFFTSTGQKDTGTATTVYINNPNGTVSAIPKGSTATVYNGTYTGGPTETVKSYTDVQSYISKQLGMIPVKDTQPTDLIGKSLQESGKLSNTTPVKTTGSNTIVIGPSTYADWVSPQAISMSKSVNATSY